MKGSLAQSSRDEGDRRAHGKEVETSHDKTNADCQEPLYLFQSLYLIPLQRLGGREGLAVV